MARVSIEYLSDSSDCETCGPSYAEGARIRVDGIVVRELIPIAHCYGGDHYGSEDILRAVLNEFGHELEGVFDE